MGTFRLLLALCVVIAHASPLVGIQVLPAGLAVKTFFIISGFYMALILAEKYPQTAEGRSLFYTNRLLRIYPMYFVTLIFALLFYAAASLYLGHPADRLNLWVQAWQQGSRGALFLIGLSQFSVIGLDVTPLFGFSPSDGFDLLTAEAPLNRTYAWRLNFLPHCWSVGAELLFYATAPLLVALRPRSQILLCAIGAGIVLAIQSLRGPLAYSANYHLGILQFPYFLLGILAYTILYKSSLFRPSIGFAVIPVLATAALTFSGWPGLGQPSGYAYLLCAWLVIPMLFQVTRHSSADRWIGELSYPIYLLHVPVKWGLLAAYGVETKDAMEVSGWALTLLTLVAATLMVALIDRPMERYRRKRFERGSAREVVRILQH